MKRLFPFLVLLAWCSSLILQTPAFAQRGMGDAEGVARSQEVVQKISGTAVVQEVAVEECTQTTGRYPVGIHLLAENSDGESLNLHLGPEPVLRKITRQIEEGTEISFKAFRTTQLPENNFIVEVIGFNGKQLTLRDESLRPRWAGQRGRRWLR